MPPSSCLIRAQASFSGRPWAESAGVGGRRPSRPRASADFPHAPAAGHLRNLEPMSWHRPSFREGLGSGRSAVSLLSVLRCAVQTLSARCRRQGGRPARRPAPPSAATLSAPISCSCRLPWRRSSAPRSPSRHRTPRRTAPSLVVTGISVGAADIGAASVRLLDRRLIGSPSTPVGPHLMPDMINFRLLDHVLLAGSAQSGGQNWHPWQCRPRVSGIRA